MCIKHIFLLVDKFLFRVSDFLLLLKPSGNFNFDWPARIYYMLRICTFVIACKRVRKIAKSNY
jgi:hypothetical protein